MRKSELEAIIQDAVNEAVEPFRRRIETLEAITVDEDDGQRRLDAAVLADALEPNAGSEDPAAVRRRART